VFAPSLNVPAGTVKLAVPLASDSCALYEPLESVTVPVGVACPLVPDTGDSDYIALKVGDGDC